MSVGTTATAGRKRSYFKTITFGADRYHAAVTFTSSTGDRYAVGDLVEVIAASARKALAPVTRARLYGFLRHSNSYKWFWVGSLADTPDLVTYYGVRSLGARITYDHDADRLESRAAYTNRFDVGTQLFGRASQLRVIRDGNLSVHSPRRNPTAFCPTALLPPDDRPAVVVTPVAAAVALAVADAKADDDGRLRPRPAKRIKCMPLGRSVHAPTAASTAAAAASDASTPDRDAVDAALRAAADTATTAAPVSWTDLVRGYVAAATASSDLLRKQRSFQTFLGAARALSASGI